MKQTIQLWGYLDGHGNPHMPYATTEVAGMGITSCLGNTLDDVADNLKNGTWQSPAGVGPNHGHGATPIAAIDFQGEIQQKWMTGGTLRVDLGTSVDPMG